MDTKTIKLAKDVQNLDKLPFLIPVDWRDDFEIPAKSGVYIIWDSVGLPKYIGESSNLYERFSDLHRLANHTFRRHVVDKILRTENPKTKLVDEYIHKNYKISFIQVEFGRKELEEYLIFWCKYKQYKIFNKEQKRLYKNETYSLYLD